MKTFLTAVAVTTLTAPAAFAFCGGSGMTNHDVTADQAPDAPELVAEGPCAGVETADGFVCVEDGDGIAIVPATAMVEPEALTPAG